MTTPNYSSGPTATDGSTGLGTPTDTGTTGMEGTTGVGGSTGSGAKEQAQQTAGTAKDEAQNVVGVAKDQARNVAGEAQHQARNLVEDAKSQVDQQSRAQRDRLVGTLQEFSSQLDTMASGEGSPSGIAQDMVRQVADRTRDLSSRMDGREPTDLLDDVRSFARRKPGTFLLGALAAGVVAGRLTKGAKEAHSDNSSPGGSVYDSPSGSVYDSPSSPVYDSPIGTGYPATDPAPTGGTSTAPLDPSTGSVPDTGTATGSMPDASGTESPWNDNPTHRRPL